MNEINKRNISVDLVKTIAIIGVLVIHISSRLLTQTEVGGFEWISGLWWGAIFRASVPLFLMCSGAIMLDSNKPVSIKKLYFHNIARIIAAMLFWGFAYKIYHLLQSSQLNFQSVIYSLKRLVLFDQEFHFYYIHMILVVYAFLPLTRVFAEKADKKLLEYSLILWFVLAIIFPALMPYYPFNLLSGMTNQWPINMTYASIGYGVLGYYLKKYPLSFKKALFSFLAGFLTVFGMTFYLSYKSGVLNEMFLQGTSIGVCIMAAGIFSLSNYVKLKENIIKAVVYISKGSFCIYLSHMFVLYILEHFSVTAFIMPSILSVPLISAVVMAVCILIYTVISKIPIINKWIV